MSLEPVDGVAFILNHAISPSLQLWQNKQKVFGFVQQLPRMCFVSSQIKQLKFDEKNDCFIPTTEEETGFLNDMSDLLHHLKIDKPIIQSFGKLIQTFGIVADLSEYKTFQQFIETKHHTDERMNRLIRLSDLERLYPLTFDRHHLPVQPCSDWMDFEIHLWETLWKSISPCNHLPFEIDHTCQVVERYYETIYDRYESIYDRYEFDTDNKTHQTSDQSYDQKEKKDSKHAASTFLSSSSSYDDEIIGVRRPIANWLKFDEFMFHAKNICHRKKTRDRTYDRRWVIPIPLVSDNSSKRGLDYTFQWAMYQYCRFQHFPAIFE
jgi:hypothetical protein